MRILIQETHRIRIHIRKFATLHLSPELGAGYSDEATLAFYCSIYSQLTTLPYLPIVLVLVLATLLQQFWL
jgi:hypothetical protein